MMTYNQDSRIVMTLDAGGTNLVFSALQGYQEVVPPLTLPAQGDNLSNCLENIERGFRQIRQLLPQAPVAISFAFPGPADYRLGIIGDLGNLPGFRGGVALGPMLEGIFGIPVFINNDGNLFTLGEAIAGFLPHVNRMLAENRSPKRFHVLLGITLGTGFGAGICIDNKLLVGDNSAAGEIWLVRHKLQPEWNAEEGVSARAVKREYAKKAGIAIEQCPEPHEIFSMASESIPGNRDAACNSFNQLGVVLGDALANAVTLIDGLIVIGGGLSGAHPFFLPQAVAEMNGTIGSGTPRLETKVFNLEDKAQLEYFLSGESRQIIVPGSKRRITYDPLSRIGVGVSRLGTAKAVAVGAYIFALTSLDSLSGMQDEANG